MGNQKMPLPSKQNMIYSTLLRMFRERKFENGRLPSENELAAQLGVARRTLRYTLAKLEEEGILLRTNHGTFLKKEIREREMENPITVLVPCPDYQTASGYWSSFLTQQMILGAMEAAIRAGTYAVTLPITLNNNPDEIELGQFKHLDSDSMILTSGIEWAPAIYQILIERRCRCGVISTEPLPLKKFAEKGTPLLNCYLDNYWSCLGDAVKQLSADGARKIVYFGRDSTDISKYGQEFFLEACRELGMDFSEESYKVFPAELTCHQLFARLGDFYSEIHFDGVIFDSGIFYDLPGDLDFYGETGIPRETRMILGVSELLKYPDFPAHTRVLHRPQRETAEKLAEFLLSGKTGQFSFRCEYKFPCLEEFFRRTEK